jgi:hypothetical protein
MLSPSGELLSIWAGLDYVRANGVFVLSMPNVFNFSYYHIIGLYVVMAIYIPGSPFLFGHMVTLRKKALSAPSKPKGQ